MAANKATLELTQRAAHAAADKKASDLVAIDLSEQMVLSEVFLIVTGQNVAQVDAIADEVERKLAVGLHRSRCSCTERKPSFVLHA